MEGKKNRQKKNRKKGEKKVFNRVPTCSMKIYKIFLWDEKQELVLCSLLKWSGLIPSPEENWVKKYPLALPLVETSQFELSNSYDDLMICYHSKTLENSTPVLYSLLVFSKVDDGMF